MLLLASWSLLDHDVSCERLFSAVSEIHKALEFGPVVLNTTSLLDKVNINMWWMVCCKLT